MKVLHINSYYSRGKFYKNLYDKQIKSGLEIDVFVPVTLSFEEKDFDFGKYTTISRNHTRYDRYVFHLKHYKILKDIEKKYDIEKYSLIHAHSLFSNGFIAMKLKERYGIPYIVAVRNADINVFFSKMIHLRKLGNEILKNADNIVFLSRTYRDEVTQKYTPKDSELNKIAIIPNGIDDFWFDHIGLPRKLDNRLEIKLLQIGNINKNKNIEMTIKAAKLLEKKGYMVKLTLVGKIENKGLFNKIRNLSFVDYLGYKSREELIEIYQENDIFILPSIKETFGLVFAEALSQGLPVIYTKGQGFDEQFKNGRVGYSVKHDSANHIMEAVVATIENYESISKNCINQVNKFNWAKVSKQYIEIYREL